MSTVLVRRWLKVADPTAITARETLQRALSYGNRVRDVHRSEVFAFTSEAPEADLRAGLGRLAGDTNLLRNPNKHHLETAAGGDILGTRGTVSVLVVEPGAGEALAETVRRHRLLEPSPGPVRTGTLWELDLDVDDPAATALEMAVSVDRGHGLLANPHVHTVRVLPDRPTAEAVASGLERAAREETDVLR